MRFILVLSLLIVIASGAEGATKQSTQGVVLNAVKDLPATARNNRRIPAPQITSSTEILAPGDKLSIRGSGFINNYPQGHIIYLKNDRGLIYKLVAQYSNATELITTVPDSIPYGDYQIGLILKTRYLKSQTATSLEPSKLRPRATSIAVPSFSVFKNLNELDNILSSEDNNGHELIYAFDNDLLVGVNKLRAYYYDASYLSIASPAIDIVLILENLIANKLELNGSQTLVRRINHQDLELELPSKIYRDINNTQLKSARLLNRDSLIDVSAYTHKTNGDYSEELYLSTPSSPKYLSVKAFSSPVKISQIHVKSPESALLYNQSSRIFPLAGCSLSDNVTTRHNFFEPSSIAAGDPFLYTGDLGLNDTGGDSLSLDCLCSHPLLVEAAKAALNEAFIMPSCSSNKMRLDNFSYETLDASGFGLR